MAKQKRDAAKTQAAIIKNAMELFAKRGYEGASLDEVAAASDINKAMIFYYFKNKAGLYEAVMREILETMYKEIQKAKEECSSIKEELRAFVLTHASFAKRYPYFSALMLRELSDGGLHIPQLMFESMKKLFMLLGDILARGQKEGLFCNVLPVAVHFMIIGTINLIVVTAPLRQKAQHEHGVASCGECSIEEISEYIYKKVLLLLEVDCEKNTHNA